MTVPRKRPLPSPDEIKTLLRYDREAGRLIWLPRQGRAQGGVPVGTNPFRRERCGYWRIRIGENNISEHWVVWAICTGMWPKGEIDHIDGNRKNNRFENLRDVDRTTNLRNSALDKRNTIGCSDVREYRPGRWLAQISDGNSRRYLGSFDNPEAAVAARKAAEREIGYHPNHGRVPEMAL